MHRTNPSVLSYGKGSGAHFPVRAHARIQGGASVGRLQNNRSIAVCIWSKQVSVTECPSNKASRRSNSGFVLFINMEFGRGGHAQRSGVVNDAVDSEPS